MNNVLIVLAVAVFLWGLEHLIPSTPLRKIRHWHRRALIFNSIQACIAIASTFLWDEWFANVSLFSLDTLSTGVQVAIGYLTITFIYYWWHRARHSISLLWRYLHQFHHSPERIEIITSFYKNPLEITLNGILSSAILYLVLGLSVTSVSLCVLATALAEFVYHMNIKTPRVMGVFFQRPEMHCIHHQRGLHHYNYSDLPIWDMLFGTYKNPHNRKNLTGFPNDNENKIIELLKGHELES